jgi:hypothetical protein
LRLVPREGIAPIARARATIAAFLDPIDGWGEHEGLAALLCWVIAARDGRPGGHLAAVQREIEAVIAAHAAERDQRPAV